MTIKELRKEREILEETIKGLLIKFNRKTDTPITDIKLNTTRMSSMYEVDTYIYNVDIEVAL